MTIFKTCLLIILVSIVISNYFYISNAIMDTYYSYLMKKEVTELVNKYYPESK